MLALYPINRVIALIAGFYAAAVSVLTIALNLGLGSVWASLAWSTSLSVILLGWMTFGWRKVWRKWPVLNRWIYPDLNGTWSTTIHWVWGEKTGTVQATAHIVQNWLKTSIELISSESESHTIMVNAHKDPTSGRPVLYYIYQNDPKERAHVGPSHKGASILKVNPLTVDRLEGNYFTDRGTRGRFEMIRLLEDH